MSSQIRSRNPKPPESLIDFAQEHERAWGNESYTNRPTLADILNAPVVVFWKPTVIADDNPRQKNAPPPLRETITLHEQLGEVEQYLTKLLFRVGFNPLDRQLVRIFHKGQKVKIKGVKILFENDSRSSGDDGF
jgi:hypothetical protein